MFAAILLSAVVAAEPPDDERPVGPPAPASSRPDYGPDPYPLPDDRGKPTPGPYNPEPDPYGPTPTPGPREAHAVITGSSAALPGDVILLDSRRSTGRVSRWIVEPRPTRDGIPRVRYTFEEGGRVLNLSSYPGTYDIRLLVGDGASLDEATWTVTVFPYSPDGRPLPPGPGPNPEPGPYVPPNPGPGPDPQPGPSPGPDDGRYRIASKVARWAADVRTRDRAGEAGRIAQVMRTVGSAAAAGTIERDPERLGQAVLNRLSSDIRSAIGASATSNWRSFFQDQLGPEIVSLSNDGTFDATDGRAWAQMLDEVAAGLSAVRLSY